ncbi:MAG: 50S ribosomal protein L11 methyltransferase [Polyangiales bacterium]
MTNRYPFVAIDVPASLAEVASEQLFELGAEGVEQRDRTTLAREGDLGAHVGVPTGEETTVGEEEMVTLVAAFATHEAAREAIDAFDAELNPRLEEVVGDAWRDAWKEHFAPFRLSPRIVIKPPWREVEPALLEGGPHVLELEPGRAFGTGLHATTSLVSKVLDAHSAEYAGKEILDVGCGSGILALVALILGASRARAIDVDADAVRVAVENAERAGLAARVEADDTPVEKIEGTYPVVLANIQAEVLVPLAGAIMARVAPRGLLVLSGVLVDQKDRVLAAYPGFTLLEAPVEGEWVALVLRHAPEQSP